MSECIPLITNRTTASLHVLSSLTPSYPVQEEVPAVIILGYVPPSPFLGQKRETPEEGVRYLGVDPKTISPGIFRALVTPL